MRLEQHPYGRLSLAFLQVDNFKTIDDVFEYEKADALLRKLADVLLTSFGTFTDAVAFRAHGDEINLLGGILEHENKIIELLGLASTWPR